MRHLTRILFLLFLTFFSCSQQVEDGWESDELPCEHETHPVSVSFSRASLETFTEEGITEIGIYAYLKDSMVYGKNLSLNDAVNVAQLKKAEEKINDVEAEAKKHTTVVAGDNTTVTAGTNAAGGAEYKVSVKKDLEDMNSVNFGKITDDVRARIERDIAHPIRHRF